MNIKEYIVLVRNWKLKKNGCGDLNYQGTTLIFKLEKEMGNLFSNQANIVESIVRTPDAWTDGHTEQRVIPLSFSKRVAYNKYIGVNFTDCFAVDTSSRQKKQ